MTVLSLDWETRSTVSLPDCGAYVYAYDPSTDIICCAYAFDDEEPQLWHPGEPVPERIILHVLNDGEIRAFNAAFERVIWNAIAAPRYGWPVAALDQYVCTAAEAAAMSLPRSLGDAARVTGIAAQKDQTGHNLMMRLSRPRRYDEDGTPIWWDDPEKSRQLDEYCKQDVRTEQALAKVVRRLSPDERRIYLMDQRINDRGVCIDLPLVEAAQHMADTGVERANALMSELTNGGVPTVTNHARLRGWLLEHGIETDSVGKAAVAALLEGDLTNEVRAVLSLRAESGRSSIAKLAKMRQCVSPHDAYERARGLFLYHAANTARWGGRLIQPQNFPRGEITNVESLIPLVLAGDYDRLNLIEHPIAVVLSLLRAMLVARPGHRFVAGDFKSIEACVLNWLAGQDDVCALFREYFAGDASKDPYVIMARRMGDGTTRQAGKAAELGFGFGMGEKKFVSAAWSVYQVRVNEAQGLAAKKVYRLTHPRVESFWYDTESACKDAITRPGVPVTFGHHRNLKAVMSGAYLYVQLPSKRWLCYPAPRLVDALTPWGDMREQIEYSAVNGLTNQWERHRTYGGHLVENIVQAVARDLLAEAMLRLDGAGYDVVLHAHDEAVCEVPLDNPHYHEFDLRAAMEQLPAWAHGCPVAVETWQGERYRKA